MRLRYIKANVRHFGFLVIRRIMKKMKISMPDTGKDRYGYSLLDQNKTQEEIIKLISSGKPCMIGRVGGVEGNVCCEAAGVELGFKRHIAEKWIQKAHINAGFFPAEEAALMKFLHLMEESVEKVDLLGTMRISRDEFLIRSKMRADAKLTELGNLEPYYSEKPWTQVLEGKKVLVIHPYAKTIEKQYQKRRLLFENERILPEFQLKTLKAVQSIAGTKTEYADWFAALDAMYEQALQTDFDVAIIGCGAYGFPLAAKLKAAGKQAVHLGGAVQILFGIKGARWENVPQIKALYNEHWVRPSAEETPEKAKLVENGCYW